MHSNIMVDFFTMGLKDWISLNLKFCRDGIKKWSSVWDIACLAMWIWRNKEEHDDTNIILLFQLE